MKLFEEISIASGLVLPNRIVMAPMTRCWAGPGGVPTEASAAYYARRAAAGLLISEAIVVSPDAVGYPQVPGLYSTEQVAGWARVTSEVHRAGGRIFAQLWHTGRAAHSFFIGKRPIAPSAIALEGTLPRSRRLSYELPRAMEPADFEEVLGAFRRAAQGARAAGFDGVELHGANGYLIDQFLHRASNRREDEYGGSPPNQSRFPLAVVDALLEELGGTPLGVRVSPAAHANMTGEPADRAVFDYFLAELGARPLAYVHLGAFDDRPVAAELGARPSSYLRGAYPGLLVGAGSYTPESAGEALLLGRLDLVAFGRPFIANPDWVERVRHGEEVVAYEPTQLARLF